MKESRSDTISNGKEIPTEQDPRWQILIARDASYDGQFFYSVRTTRVYCRPSCASRLARPENVRFHENIETAQQAGFRPCKRCKPEQPSLLKQHSARIARICRILESTEEIPCLDELARHTGLSTYHFHRMFKAITGITPRAYAHASRAKRVREGLERNDTSVTSAIYDAGFHSSGGFYETSNQVLGMTPTKYRAGGANAQIHFAIGECSLGSILVAQSEKGVCSILMGDDPEALVRDLQNRFSKANLIGGDEAFEDIIAKVVGFVEMPSIGLGLPLDIRGTAFQQRVWQALQEIPVGATASYIEIAEKIGSPKSVRAVAGACAANPIALAIPCHRVVRNDGGLSGYRWGVERKKALLDRETAPNSPIEISDGADDVV